MSRRRILVTGGAGFIGLHLSRRLSDDDESEVTVVDDFSRGAGDAEFAELTARPNVHAVTADLTDPAAWARLGDGYDEVFHLAAIIGVRNVLERPYDVVRVNALATLHLLDWLVAGGGRKMLFSSTSEAYAWTQRFHALPVPTPEDVPLALTRLADPRSSYAGSKIFGELAVTQCCRVYDRPFVVVRFHNVYGPRMGREHVIPELFERATAGQRPLVVFSPDHRRAFCYVSDAVDAVVAAMRSPRAEGRTINIGNDRDEVAIRELASRILDWAGIDVPLAELAATNDPIRRRCPDLTRARELLGYEPRVDLDQGLDLTLSWYARELGVGAPAGAAGA
jgi:nucleoside-diphosphate-sugar epimerase